MVPTPGGIVLCRLPEDDARHIAHQRVHNSLNGNFVREGDRYPAVVVRTFPGNPDDVANLKVLLDGEDTYWATSRHQRGPSPAHGHGRCVPHEARHARPVGAARDYRLPNGATLYTAAAEA
ncbi:MULTISPECIES: hypothetical protein [unclassified Streptomyces]|uniref:hypothetical protein n=1 Tax=unclassified Streptomyces TaxID=2593676 RepID=UPI0020356495|nr:MULTISPECIES: hypothetical protein [unclassified Streptomyces]